MEITLDWHVHLHLHLHLQSPIRSSDTTSPQRRRISPDYQPFHPTLARLP